MCGFHVVVHELPQLNERHQADRDAAMKLYAPTIKLRHIPLEPPPPNEPPLFNGEQFTADRLYMPPAMPDRMYLLPEETPVVAYNQSIRQKKIHEYKLRLPAAGGDVQTAISAALRDMKVAFPDKSIVMDSVMMEATDEEIVIYWEEEL